MPVGVLCQRRELPKKWYAVAEFIHGENLCGSGEAAKRKRDSSGEGGVMQEGVEPKSGEVGSLLGGELEP